MTFSGLYHHFSTLLKSLFQRKFQHISLEAMQSFRDAACSPFKFSRCAARQATVRCPELARPRRVLRTASWRWQHVESTDGTPFKFSRCARPAGHRVPDWRDHGACCGPPVGAGSTARARTVRHSMFQGARHGGCGCRAAPAARVTRGRVAARSGGGSGRSPCPWQRRMWKTLSCTRRSQLPNTTLGELA